MRTHSETFKIENIVYEATMSSNGEFGFEMISGRSKRGSIYVGHKNPWNLFPEYEKWSDTGLLANAMTLFRTVGEILCKWVLAYKPPQFWFSASTERKLEIYRWLAAKLAKKFPNYTMVEHPVGSFIFYRHVTDGNCAM